MKRKAKKTEELWGTHVRLSAADKEAVEAIASREARSITAQITIFIRAGLADAAAQK